MRRRRAFVLTLGAGVGLAVLGFFLSTSAGAPDSPASGDPRMPFAPLLFVIGLMLMFGSAVIFELTGEPEARAAAQAETETERRAGEAVRAERPPVRDAAARPAEWSGGPPVRGESGARAT